MLKLIWPDPQIPYHHRKATGALLTMLADCGSMFNEVHQCGDLLDLKGLSKFARGTPAESGALLQKELDACDMWLRDVQQATSSRDIDLTMIRGNHDDRLRKYLATVAKGLDGLEVLRFREFANLSAWGWKMLEEPYRIAHDTVVVHGLTVRVKSGYTAHAHIEKFFPTNVVHGHTHRGAIVYRTIGQRTSWALESGHTMDPKKADYVVNPDWQLGFGVLQVTEGERTVPLFVPMKNDGSFVFDGRRWKG